jgi:signal transduction histidine kinase
MILLLAILSTSCGGVAPTHEISIVDSLNDASIHMRYRDIDSSYEYAHKAYDNAHIYGKGKAEAYNNMAFCLFVKMDFEEAERMYQSVKRHTQNEMELLIADIGLMSICQRTAMNKEFYDYRNSALKRMKRIDEDRSLFSDIRERNRLNSAYAEFRLISSQYYYSLRQRREALAEIECIDMDDIARRDSALYIRCLSMMGLPDLYAGDDDPQERRLTEFDNLYAAYRCAVASGYIFFIGDELRSISDLLSSENNYNLFTERRMNELRQFGYDVDTLLPLHLGEKALNTFNSYKYSYGVAGAYVVIGRYLNEHKRYTDALDTLAHALECVNSHHMMHYHCNSDTTDRLLPYEVENGVNVFREIKWMSDEKTKTMPEWISSIREQLSVAYAGLGMKNESDYNRNIYLDILNNTRQDRELENRYSWLKAESNKLSAILIAVITAFALTIVLIAVFNRHAKRRGQIYSDHLRRALDLCSDMTSRVPMDIESVNNGLAGLFGAERVNVERDENGHLGFKLYDKLNNGEQALLKILSPYIEWAERNEQNSDMLAEEREKLDAQRYVHQKHIEDNKRQNLVKRACLLLVSGITPYIDRIMNEVHKLLDKGYMNDEKLKEDKFKYICELADVINEQNEILSLWIKMRRGAIQLNIENFELNELFMLLQKGRKGFEMKNHTFDIKPSDCVVKADKALTLFMINTLAENARKYTPEGGHICIYASQSNEYVEISVEDNGIGMSAEDVATITNNKVYDSKEIGAKSADIKYLMKNKGSGFGLMSCKGIIEKYRKTNKLFSVCMFGVESAIGKGSRFFFRLPTGAIKRVFSLLILLVPVLMLQSCEDSSRRDVTSSDCYYASSCDTTYSVLLDSASLYADSVYFANINRDYNSALSYAEKAIGQLNKHYLTYSKDTSNKLMELYDSENDLPAEFVWWSSDFDTDYHVILDIRNEAAVAYLALRELGGYRYNNDAYTDMYKLQGKDQTIESDCRKLERSSVGKMIGVAIFVILVVFTIVLYYLIFVRKRVVELINLRQLLEINKRVFVASQSYQSETNEEALQMEEDTMHNIPQHIVEEAFNSINDLLGIDLLGMAVYDATTSTYVYVTSPGDTETSMPMEVARCGEERTIISSGRELVIPLTNESSSESHCIGALYMIRSDNSSVSETDLLLAELIAQYFSIVIYNSVICPSIQYRDIEASNEETRRASWEDSTLHVQNMVLDNCLSTIKHETIYYPNRIKHILENMSSSPQSVSDERKQIEDINELMEYYKGIFSILYSCASRQLEEVTFRRTMITIDELTDYCRRYFNKSMKNITESINLSIETVNATVYGDIISLRFLFENLIDEALICRLPGNIALRVVEDGYFIRFCFIDYRRDKKHEELDKLFTPEFERMVTATNGELSGTEFLICKQIIREHDEYAGRRGCRINAETYEGGFMIYFTLPRKIINQEK